tara:strand:+ start:89 stop:319 length:231 start_codon:yes stop_codon:yes gene_type:complete
MESKGFTDQQLDIETPNDIKLAEKPLKRSPVTPQRVDINVLKSKLQQSESKELKKNLFILSVLILLVGVLGVYLSF